MRRTSNFNCDGGPTAARDPEQLLFPCLKMPLFGSHSSLSLVGEGIEPANQYLTEANECNGDAPTPIMPRVERGARVRTPPHLLEVGLAYLASPLSHAISSALSVVFIHALGREVAEFMSNTSQQGLKIPEHTGRKINSPSLQGGKGKSGLVRMKGLTHFQKFVVFENDNCQAFIGVRGVAKVVG
jgi:hypothetical protein